MSGAPTNARSHCDFKLHGGNILPVISLRTVRQYVETMHLATYRHKDNIFTETCTYGNWESGRTCTAKLITLR